MTLFIQGLAIPLDQKNANGWGIPASEVDNVINSLKTSSLRICPGEAHACDFTGDPFGRIGRNVDAWRETDGVHAKYEVTDSVAARKLKEGTWGDLKWSTFANSKKNPVKNDGWAGGVAVKSMTLVRNPAWSQAHYQITASIEEDGPTELHTFSDFHLIASHGDDNTTLEEELKTAQLKIASLETELAASKESVSVSASTIDSLTTQVTTLTASVTEKDKSLSTAVNDVSEAKTQVDELTASVEKLTKEIDEKTTLIASLEKEKAGSVPMDQLDTIIAAAIEKHDTEKEAKAVLSAARERFVTARKELGMETKPEEFTTLSAADFDTMTEMLSVKLAAGGAGSGPQIRYPANPVEVDYSFATGAYDAKTGKWV